MFNLPVLGLWFVLLSRILSFRGLCSQAFGEYAEVSEDETEKRKNRHRNGESDGSAIVRGIGTDRRGDMAADGA